MRTLGIEEELLVVDCDSGRPMAVQERVLGRVEETKPADAGDTPGGSVGGELQQQQVETGTTPCADLEALEADVRRWREVAVSAAEKEGARIIASGTSPQPVTPQPIDDERYQHMRERYGLTTDEHMTCGCHVHVAVDSPDEGVGVLDRIRVWLPVLLAVTANSPFWQGRDSGYASFRSQAMVRWPTVGPTDLFGTAEAYRERVESMLATGVLFDEGMVYFDARLSANYPTVEIRVADVCLDAEDAVLHAALCRALVDAAAEEWASGRPAPDVPTGLLRLATWQAGREGVDGQLLDPLSARPRPAGAVLDDLMEHLRPALKESGDLDLVEERLTAVRERGNGARRQCAVLERTGSLADVVADLARVTAGREHG